MRDGIIRERKILRGSKYVVSEDLTTLNVQTISRMNKNNLVQKTWSWNGKLFALLKNNCRPTTVTMLGNSIKLVNSVKLLGVQLSAYKKCRIDIGYMKSNFYRALCTITNKRYVNRCAYGNEI